MQKSNIIGYRKIAAKREKAISKELMTVEKQEKRLEQAAVKPKPASWKDGLENKIPPKVYSGLESAFCKGFAVVFDQGKAVIEKGFNKEEIKVNHQIRDYAVQVKGGRKELKLVRKGGGQSAFLNLAATTVEGIALGALGIGMPDIVLFLGMLLLLRQLNNRNQSSLYFVRAGWSKYAFTWSGSPDKRPIKAEVLSSNSWMSWTMAWEPTLCFRSLLRYSSGLYSGE